MPTALITGGTSGIGAAFARALAARGTDLVLVARDEQRLAETAAALHAEHGIRVDTLVADLADRGDTERVADRLRDCERPIDLLVNNAGFGMKARLVGPDVAVHERALDVMLRAVLVLSGAAAEAMVERGRGAILNVSSFTTYMATGAYSAIKAWVTNYTEGLANELHGTGVRTMALLPGWVRTEFHDRAGIRSGSIPEALWIDPDALVRQALRDLDHGRVISMPTVRYKVLQRFARHAPRSWIRQTSRVISASRRDPAQ